MNECCRAQRAVLMGEPTAALDAARRASAACKRNAAEGYPVERDRVEVEHLLGASLTLLASQSWDRHETLLVEAEAHLVNALAGCRRIEFVELEPNALLAWSALHRVCGKNDLARQRAQEALEIADRCEYRLKQADAHLALARLALDAGDAEGARVHAEIAKERALCDGPPHYYKPAFDEAERLLAEANHTTGGA